MTAVPESQKQQQYESLLGELATLLGGKVVDPFKPACDTQYIEMPSGYWLWISQPGWQTRDGKSEVMLERYHHPVVNGLSDYNWNPDKLSTSISLSLSKGSAAVAADIKRRLLPTCEALWQKVISARQKRDSYIASVEDMASRLNEVWPDIDHKSEYHKRTLGKGHLNPRTKFIDKCYVGGVGDDRSVNIEFSSLPFDIAVELLKLLRILLEDKITKYYD